MKNLLKYFYFAISIFLYGFIAFYLQRTDFVSLVISFAILFFCYYKLVVDCKENIRFLIISTIAFRLVFGWVLPNLSQDFYRFIWDGRLVAQGLNPYIYLPKNIILDAGFHLRQATELFAGMGSLSAEHFSNYPPINQLFFAIAGLLAGNSIVGSVVVLRLIIITADLGTLYFGQKLLKNLGLDSNRIFWYLLNPLVVLELSGNLHFEGVMLFFLVFSMYLLQQNFLKWSAFVLAISISIKLLPILLLPIFYKYLGFKKALVFYSIIIIANILFLAPFFSTEFIDNYSSTIGLWFTNFEFNASIYYVIRAIGFHFYGYNLIHTIGKIIPVLVVLFILYKSFFTENRAEVNLLNSFLTVLSVYFFTATTVHPWYVVNLVLISVFTKYRFPLVWSFLIVLSYFAYSVFPFEENLGMVFIEYIVIFTVLIYEIINKPVTVKSEN